MKKVSIKDTTVMSGIYLIEYPNKKIYIGQAQNIHLRVLEHNSRAKVGRRGDKRPLQLCDKKIREYFDNGIKEYIVLEECSIDELDSREDYWIEYYNALDKNIGYNFLDRGDVSGRRGVENVNASLDKERLELVIDLLQNHYELSYQDIADRVGVSLWVIQSVNWGKTYIDSNLEYPLREYNTHVSTQKNEVEDYFKDKQQLISLKEDLKWSWWLKVETDLVKKYGIPLRIMHSINNGRKFGDIGDYTYPIRKKNIKNKNDLSKGAVLEILNLLKTTNTPMATIGKQYNFERSTISKINQGTAYPIKNYNYPARKTN